jgi:hypothetical protein
VKILATAFLLLLTLVARPAAADPMARHIRPFLNPTSTTVVVPAEWAGVWLNTDTAYTCAGAFKSTDTWTDTLCTGQVFESDTTFDCTGSFDANSYTEHCTATGELFTDCQYTFTLDAHGTRTTDSFSSVATNQTSYSGTGTGCDLFPPSCTQVNTHGTRIGPAPAAYCATPTRPTTWGQMKALYR